MTIVQPSPSIGLALSIREARRASIIEAMRDAAQVVCARLPMVSSVILFGSFARGDWSPSSDVDIAVVASPTLDSEQLEEVRQQFVTASGKEVDVVVLAPDWDEARVSVLSGQIDKFGVALT